MFEKKILIVDFDKLGMHVLIAEVITKRLEMECSKGKDKMKNKLKKEDNKQIKLRLIAQNKTLDINSNASVITIKVKDYLFQLKDKNLRPKKGTTRIFYFLAIILAKERTKIHLYSYFSKKLPSKYFVYPFSFY